MRNRQRYTFYGWVRLFFHPPASSRTPSAKRGRWTRSVCGLIGDLGGPRLGGLKRVEPTEWLKRVEPADLGSTHDYAAFILLDRALDLVRVEQFEVQRRAQKQAETAPKNIKDNQQRG